MVRLCDYLCVFLSCDSAPRSSRLPHPKRSCQPSSLPRKTVCVVRVRCHEEGLGLAPQHDGVRPPLPQSFRAGARVPSQARRALEGTLRPLILTDGVLTMCTTAIRTRGKVGLRAAPFLVHRIYLLGLAQRSSRSLPASLSFRPGHFQG